MRGLSLIAAIAMGLSFAHHPVWAARAYVTDTLRITLRTGPSIENQIIAMLSTGEPVEVLERTEDWSRVRVLRSGGDQKVGWVLSRFLMDREPWESRAQRLAEANASLKGRLARLEERWNEASGKEESLEQRLRQTQQALDTVRADYEALKNGASDYLKLKEEYDSLRTTLSSAQETLEVLTRENEVLRLTHKIKWFLVGALVLLAGWLIGLSMGRMQRKRRSPYY